MVKCCNIPEHYFLGVINMSLSSGVFIDSLKYAINLPVLKDPSTDPDVLKNYRPVSNTPFIAELIEITVLQQINDKLCHSKLYIMYHNSICILTRTFLFNCSIRLGQQCSVVHIRR